MYSSENVFVAVVPFPSRLPPAAFAPHPLAYLFRCRCSLRPRLKLCLRAWHRALDGQGRVAKETDEKDEDAEGQDDGDDDAESTEGKEDDGDTAKNKENKQQLTQNDKYEWKRRLYQEWSQT